MKLKDINEDLKIVPGVFINSTTFLDKDGNQVPLRATDLYSLAQDEEEDDKTYSADDLDDKDDLDSWFSEDDLNRELNPDGLERLNRDGGNIRSKPKNKPTQFDKPIMIDDSTGKQFYYNNGELIEI